MTRKVYSNKSTGNKYSLSYIFLNPFTLFKSRLTSPGGIQIFLIPYCNPYNTVIYMTELSAWKLLNKLGVEKMDEPVFQWTCFKNCWSRLTHRHKPTPHSTVWIKDRIGSCTSLMDFFFLSWRVTSTPASQAKRVDWHNQRYKWDPAAALRGQHKVKGPARAWPESNKATKANSTIWIHSCCVTLFFFFLSTSTHLGSKKASSKGSFL